MSFASHAMPIISNVGRENNTESSTLPATLHARGRSVFSVPGMKAKQGKSGIKSGKSAAKKVPGLVNKQKHANPGGKQNPRKSTAELKPANSCARLPKTTSKPRAGNKIKRALDQVWRIFARNYPVFVGFHGTNSKTANMWMGAGFISKPVGGTSGADAELGDGLYVTDQRTIAHSFAAGNARHNRGTQPSICAISTNQGFWQRTRKAFIPTSLIRNAQARDRYLFGVLGPNARINEAVRFSALDTTGNRPGYANQMLIPIGLERNFYAQCFNLQGGILPPQLPKDISYNERRGAWNIVAENDISAQCALAIATTSSGGGWFFS